MRNIMPKSITPSLPTPSSLRKLRQSGITGLFGGETDYFDLIRQIFRHLFDQNAWQDKSVHLKMNENSAPRDCPAVKANGRTIEAEFLGSIGQAVTLARGEFAGSSDTLGTIGAMRLDEPYRKAVFLATINAVARHLGIVNSTIHCKDDEPAQCAKRLVSQLKEKFGKPKLALVGMQRQMAEALSREFEVRVTDVDMGAVGTSVFGIHIQGPEYTADNIAWSDVAVVMGSAFSNGTLRALVRQKPTVFYAATNSGRMLPHVSLSTCLQKPTICCGITAAAAARFLKLTRFCPFGA